MRFKLNDVEAVFRYGSLSTSDDKLTCIDIKKWYQDLGGSITPGTEIEFSTYFPGKPYAKTALTDNMPSSPDTPLVLDDGICSLLTLFN